MSQPVKLSDALVLDARIVGEAQERSIARQVEFWAKLGRSLETLLDGRQVLALSRSISVAPLAAAVASVGTQRARTHLANYLESLPFPHYDAHPTIPGLLVRTEEDGTKTVGRFINREFVRERRLGRKQPAAVARSTRSPKSAGARG